jgi:hypothetical protein
MTQEHLNLFDDIQRTNEIIKNNFVNYKNKVKSILFTEEEVLILMEKKVPIDLINKASIQSEYKKGV